MDVIQVFLFILIVIVSFFSIFLGMKVDFLMRYLYFTLIASFWLVVILNMQIFLWLILFCGVGLILNSPSSIAKKSLLLVATVLFIFLHRVPLGPSEFDDYLQEEHGLYCKSVECLQISGEENLNVQTDISAIQSRDFHWYFFWSKGEITTESQSIEATNVMGFWLPK